MTLFRAAAVIPGINFYNNIIGRTRPFNCNNYSSGLEWECDDGYCIERYSVCDGEYDCLDGTDEFDCGEPAR